MPATATLRPPAPDSEGATQVQSIPRFLQGVYAFEGKGLDQPAPVDASLSYLVPDGAVAQAVYFRGGNAAAELICAVLVRDGEPMRWFPIGARSDVHVPLRVMEDLGAGTHLELWLSAPGGLTGLVVVDLGLVEV
jgi:hypothetical protein